MGINGGKKIAYKKMKMDQLKLLANTNPKKLRLTFIIYTLWISIAKRMSIEMYQ